MKVKIDQVMAKNLITIKATESVQYGYLKMKEHGIRHLPVIGLNEDVIGIISDRDIQRAMMSLDPSEFTFNPDDVVGDFMKSKIISVEHDSELLSVVQKMIDHQISSVLITQESNLVGIITHEDLLLILTDLLKPKTDVITQVQTWLYKTPIGQVAERLATIGI